MKNTFIIIDNSLYMQNQDYLPKRFICEKETIYKIIADILEARVDANIAIIPTSFKYPNNFISPTNNRQKLINFLNGLELCDKFEINYAMQILQVYSQTKQEANIIFFLGTKLIELNLSIYEEIAKYSNLKVILFGEALDLNLKGRVLHLRPDKDFFIETHNFLGSKNVEEDDPVLKMVLEKSRGDY
ncbi:26S proteasome non-ATPase regulatory subunit 4 like protein [Cucumispora dikerogammari]|nr:26S proteasome non-ATPase regulatory subunit 4 like protein [Cucumispora dikerogammari]